MKKTTRVDWGNFDWVIGKDADGHIWIRPSLRWDDGEVYETFSSETGGKLIYEDVIEGMERLEE